MPLAARTNCLVPVPVESFALATIHGDILLSRAVDAAQTAGFAVSVVVADDAFEGVVHVVDAAVSVVRVGDVPAVIERTDVVLVHDPLCPLTPGAFLTSMVAHARAGSSTVGVLPVTDTIKGADDSVITSTLDRSELRLLASPLVAVAEAVDLIRQEPDLVLDLPRLVRRLMADCPIDGAVDFVPAPSVAARVSDRSDVELLQAVEKVYRA
jgi:2-C-methyl-D-erythritol 4-phosphate cytidylyltransferase